MNIKHHRENVTMEPSIEEKSVRHRSNHFANGDHWPYWVASIFVPRCHRESGNWPSRIRKFIFTHRLHNWPTSRNIQNRVQESPFAGKHVRRIDRW